MEPKLCTSDFIYFIEEDTLLDNRVSGREPQSPVDALDLASMPVNGWQRVMLSEGDNGNDFYIVAMPKSDHPGEFERPYGDSESEFEALISF